MLLIMIRKIKVLNMYSDLNTQLDIIVVVYREEQLEQAEHIMTKSYNDCFEDKENQENKLALVFCAYLESQLKKEHIGYELYIKVGDSL